MSKPLVSILIPAYNAEKFVKAAIDSALGQTYKNIEVVVINDGSTDGTAEAVKPYLSDKRIIYFEQPNGGISKARNKAFELSHGDYITFLDADDLEAPSKVEDEVNFLESHKDYGVAYCRVLSFYDDAPDKKYGYDRTMPSGDIFRELLRHQFINPGSVMMRRDVFASENGFNPDFRDAEDWDLWRRLSYKGVKFGYVDKPLHYNRMSRKSLSGFHNQVKMKKMNLRSFRELFARMTEKEREKYGEKKIIRLLLLKLAVAYLLLGNKKEALVAFKEAWEGSVMAILYPFVFLSVAVIPGRIISATIKFFWQRKHKMLFYEE
ncbi:MAG TPA: glycosyltransferase [Candidatus Paceibacterota bacterium]|nr:glycosyltransferase [Candidatus Paceibacterota bacterium]